MSGGRFLSEFPGVSTEAWERAICGDLKGAGNAATLIWNAEDGLAIKPFYRAEDLGGLGFPDAAPGDFPYVRGTAASAEWRIREEIDEQDPEAANQAALQAVAGGAEEIAFRGTKLATSSDLGLFVAGLAGVPIYLKGVDQQAIGLIVARLKTRPHRASVCADLDWSANPGFAAELIAEMPAELVPFNIPAEEFQECGAGRIEEVGFTLAAAVDFVEEMKRRGLSADRAADAAGFSFSMGPEFFLEIAKLRAFRLAWAQAAECMGIGREHAKARIHARTSYWNRTVYDARVNMLRATTEAMSAVLGGADTVSTAPYDECYKAPDENSRRLARNIQLILKHEAQLARVADPGGGAYALEAVTGQIAAKAWKVFQEIEAAGGYRAAIADGLAGRILEQRKTARQLAIAQRRRVLTGTNRFADPRETALDRIDAGRGERRWRAGQMFEALRLRTERHIRRTGTTPLILLAEIGDAKMRTARSGFAADLLACAGLPSQARRFESAEAIAGAKADLIVLCSSDAEYLAIATVLLPRLRAAGTGTPVLVAGNPESAEQLKAGGIADFLHMRRNAVEFLTALLQTMGIGA